MRFFGSLVASLVLMIVHPAWGAQHLSDDELSQVTAAGAFSIELTPGQELPGVTFGFNAGGGTTGVGSVNLQAPALGSTVTVNGNPVFSGNQFDIQNMILNLNVCMHCQAGGDIIQSGQGYVFPFEFR